MLSGNGQMIGRFHANNDFPTSRLKLFQSRRDYQWCSDDGADIEYHGTFSQRVGACKRLAKPGCQLGIICLPETLPHVKLIEVQRIPLEFQFHEATRCRLFGSTTDVNPIDPASLLGFRSAIPVKDNAIATCDGTREANFNPCPFELCDLSQ